jgi:hypothetical protein
MSASFMNRTLLRTILRTATVAMVVIGTGACSDQQITGNSAPPAPVGVNPSTVGMLRGTVREDGTVLLESMDPSIQVGDGASGAIYGNQNVTARVTTSAFNLANNGTTKTWTFKLAVHNLLNYPVGSIDGAAVPQDTIGMYVFFPTAPTAIAPNPCSGCAISILNTQGFANFTAPNQQYYWYHDRLSARGQPGDSTTNIPTWTFTASSTVTSFRFTIILSSPWPRGILGGDTTWSVFYNPSVDSIPDVNGKPRWKTTGVNNTAVSTLTSGTLMMFANHKNGGGVICVHIINCSDDRYYYRSDNLDRAEQAYIEARFSLTSDGTDPSAIIALADSVKFAGLGVGNGKVGFATFNQFTEKWEWFGPTFSITTTAVHAYRLGKSGTTGATIYVDGVEKLSANDSVLPSNFVPNFTSNVTTQAVHLSSFFGITGEDADATAKINYVTYAFHATPKPQ